MRLINFTLSVLLLASLSLQAQINFSARPASMQVYPRNNNDSATVTIAGQVTTTGYTSAIFTMHKSGVLSDSTIVTLSYNGSTAAFTQAYSIHAEKSHHRFKMYLYDGATATLLLRADSVCSGDAYVVYGQSNAVSISNGPGYDIAYVWVRSFGTQSNVDVTCQSDTTWGMGNGAGSNNHMSIGVWAMRLGKMLADSANIPVCIINGGRSAARITDLLPSTIHTDLTTYYGRFLYRVQKAGISSKIKALFYYQGESDADTASLQYANRFGQLYNGFKSDMPGIAKFVEIQIRPGCLIGSTMLYHQQLRETQRTLSSAYPDVTLATTVGIPNFDGCHFYTNGYQQFAAQLYSQFCDEFINKPVIPESDPPRLLSASYTNNSNTELSLVFDQAVVYPSLYNGYDLKDYLYLYCTANVLSGSSSGDTIKLQLSASTNSNKITYLPGYYYSGANTEYQGPWLLNSRGVGTASFYQYSINNLLTISADRPTAICPSDSVILSTLRTGQSYQWYQNGNLITGAINQQYVAKTAGTYTLVVKDLDNLAVSSNSIVVSYGSGTKPVISSSTSKSVFCSGNSITLSSDIGTSWLWNTGETTSSIIVNTQGGYAVGITTGGGCLGISDTFVVTLDIPSKPIIAYNKSGMCPGDSIMLSVNGNTALTWNTGSTQPFIFVTDSNRYSVSTSDSIGCVSISDTVSFPIRALPDAYINSSSLRACPGQTITLSSVNTAASYLWSSGQTTASIGATSSGEYGLTITDTYGCVGISPSVQLFFALPVVSVTPAGSKIICTGIKQTLTAVYNSTPGSFQWYRNGASLSGALNSYFQASTAGTYTVRYTDVYGCSVTSAGTVLTVSALPTASFTITNQFDVCNDTVATLTANTATGLTYQWQKNSIDIQGAINRIYDTQTKGTYRVITANAAGCSKTSGTGSLPQTNLTATITASGPLTFCSYDSVVLTANSGAGYIYQWLKSTTNIAGATLQSYTVKTSGNYKVKITNNIGCTALSSFKTTVVTTCAAKRITSDDTYGDDELSLYPQPVNNEFTLHLLKANQKDNYYFDVLNAEGALVMPSTKIIFNDGGDAHINATLLPPGIYFFKLVNDKKVYNGRLLKD